MVALKYKKIRLLFKALSTKFRFKKKKTIITEDFLAVRASGKCNRKICIGNRCSSSDDIKISIWDNFKGKSQ